MTSRSAQALTRATQQRTKSAEEAVVRAIDAALTGSEQVTVAGIAAAARVSTDFIYRHPILRPQVEQLRRKSPAQINLAADDIDHHAAASPLIRRLTQQITRERAEHRAELGRLRAALESAHGDLLRLRRELDDQPGAHPE